MKMSLKLITLEGLIGLWWGSGARNSRFRVEGV